jgi:hypothetical protein
MGWASRNKETRVGILKDDGTPAKPEETRPEAQADGDSGTVQPGPDEAVAEVKVTLKGDGGIRVDGPGDFRIVLRMLHEATDIVVTKLAAAQVFSQLQQMQRGIAKPALSEVLALGKR